MESTKNADIRINNRKRVVNTLFRQGAMTKRDLAERLDLSLATLTLLLKELKAKKLIANGMALDSTGGRKPLLLEPAYDVKYSVGIEVSQHELRIVAIDLGSHVLAKEIYPYGMDTSREYWQKASAVAEEFIAAHIKNPKKLLDIGLALQSCKNCTDHQELPQSRETGLNLAMVQSCFRHPLIVRSSAKQAALAQIWGANHRDRFVYVSASSALGGAIVYDHRVIDVELQNCLFGSLLLPADSFLQSSGSPKRLEDFCTVNALCAKTGSDSIGQFFQKLQDGDVLCKKAWEQALDAFSILFYNLHQIFGWKVVAGGSLSPLLLAYQEDIEKRLAKMAEGTEPYTSYVTVSDLGVHSAAIGAAMLSIDRFLETGFNDL